MIIAINLSKRYVTTDDGRSLPITNLFDGDGEEVEREEDVQQIVCGQGAEWYRVFLTDELVTYH